MLDKSVDNLIDEPLSLCFPCIGGDFPGYYGRDVSSSVLVSPMIIWSKYTLKYSLVP